MHTITLLDMLLLNEAQKPHTGIFLLINVYCKRSYNGGSSAGNIPCFTTYAPTGFLNLSNVFWG